MFRALLIVVVCALVSFSDANDEESGTLNLGDVLLKEELVNVPYQLWSIVRKDVEYEGVIIFNIKSWDCINYNFLFSLYP